MRLRRRLPLLPRGWLGRQHQHAHTSIHPPSLDDAGQQPVRPVALEGIGDDVDVGVVGSNAAVAGGWQEGYNEQGLPVLRKLRDGARSPRPFTPAATTASASSSSSSLVLSYRRTWEVLKANGLWSYELHRSPRYRDAVLAFARDFCPPATSKVGRSLRGSYWAGDQRHTRWRPTVMVVPAPADDDDETEPAAAAEEEEGGRQRAPAEETHAAGLPDEEEGRAAGVAPP